MSQDYAEGCLYEELCKLIFEGMYDIEIEVFHFDDYPDLQNRGIDAKIVQPKHISSFLQVKMFKNTEKYGTFPWEVSRFLTKENKFIVEPHEANFHAIIDPIFDSQELVIHMWVIKTAKLPQYYRQLWTEAVDKFGEPSASNNNWIKKQGLVEEYYSVLYKGETLYQLIKSHTAYQRNVRCLVNSLKDIFQVTLRMPKSIFNLLEQGKYPIDKYVEYLQSQSLNKSQDLTNFLNESLTKEAIT